MHRSIHRLPFFLGAVLACCAVAAAPASAQSNIVVVMTDDQRADDAEVMASVQRRIADRGATFENFMVSFPLCCPSRATFLTGQYAHNHGVRDNIGSGDVAVAFRNPETAMPVALDEAGYRTGLIGKYLNRFGPADPVPPGWDIWRAAVRGGYQPYDYELDENGRIRRYGNAPRDYRTNVYADKAVNFIETAHEAGDPFFLTVTPGVPHVEGKKPPTPGPDYDGRFDREPLPDMPSFNELEVDDKPQFIQEEPQLTRKERAHERDVHRGRLASLLPVDDLVDRVVQALRRTGELDDTYVVFTSDNGRLLGEHRLTGKIHLYEEAARVPMMIRGPGVPPGVTREQVAANIDFAPTFMEIAGATPLREMDGRSLLPYFAGDSVPRDILLENFPDPVVKGGGNVRAVRNASFMYAEHPSGERELYDLRIDPFQLNSVHDDSDYADEMAELATRLDQLRDCAGVGCR